MILQQQFNDIMVEVGMLGADSDEELFEDEILKGV